MAIMAVNKTNRFVRLSRVEADFCMIGNCKFCILYYLFLCLLVVETKGQIMDLDSIKSDYFKKYDIVFIGEQHNIKDRTDAEIKLLDLLITNQVSMCLEQAFTWNIPNRIVYINQDLSYYHLPNDSWENLYHYFFNKKITVKSIDVIKPKYMYKREILKLYESKIQDSIVKSDVRYFRKIGKVRFPFEYKNSERYGGLMDSIKKHKHFHKLCLESDTSDVFDLFEALESGFYTHYDYSAPHSQVASTYRENFMLKMLSREIDTHSKVISINGFFHISINGKESEVQNPNWVPLATLVKNNYPDKKICSIYLCKYGKDKFLEKYYKTASDYILSNCSNEKDCIINLNSADSSFNELKSKYTHIVVF